MYKLIRKFLFTFDAEVVHERTISALKAVQRLAGGKNLLRVMYRYEDPRLHTHLWGIDFPNPVGLAAGFDKNAEVYEALAALGFGFIEVGTLTPLPQPGNEKPRLFRSPADQAIINRMGFNNHGAGEAAKHLRHFARAGVPIGINIGKNKVTANEDAASDYRKCLDLLYTYGHYFVINVSSPNTPQLRDLQETENLRRLLQDIRAKVDELVKRGVREKPVLLKVAPDMSKEQMRDIVRVAVSEGISGIIATNTTLSREGLRDPDFATNTGGLSGRPLTECSTEWIREIYREVGGKIPIIGVGGIFTGDDAYEKIRAGASLVQIYTGMVYEGPGVVKSIKQRLLELLTRDGFANIQQAVGADHRE
jgi:dihydroorotate dehydrogenase